jgi:hypothetical protein
MGLESISQADTIMALTGHGTGRRSTSAITRLAATAATRTALAVTVIPIITAVTATAITMGVTATMAAVTTGAMLTTGVTAITGAMAIMAAAAIMVARAITEDAATTVATATTMGLARRPLPTAVVMGASTLSAVPGGQPLSGAALVVFERPGVSAATQPLSPVAVAALVAMGVFPVGMAWAVGAERRWAISRCQPLSCLQSPVAEVIPRLGA